MKKLTANEVADAIWNGGFNQEELTRINEALRVQWKVARNDKLIEAQGKLRNGVRVMLTGVRPKRLNGIRGTVENFYAHNHRCDLRITETNWASARNVGELIRRVPLTCLEIIPDTGLRKSPDAILKRASKK